MKYFMHMKGFLKQFGWMLGILAGLLLLTAVAACVSTEPVDGKVRTLAQDYLDAREDGKIDAAEIKRLDRDVIDLAEAVEQRPPAFSLPATGVPWLDALVRVGELAATAAAGGYFGHKTTMKVRDRLAAATPPTDTPEQTA